jgi:hypothetical protein
VYHKPNGEYGLMVETLASPLTPILLEQLVRSLAYRVDLPVAYLQSLSDLQRVMNEWEPDLSQRAGSVPAKADLERWQNELLTQCRQMNLECTLKGDFSYQLRFRPLHREPIQLDYKNHVVTLQARIGDQYRLDHQLYERILNWNYSAKLGKLTLSPTNEVILSYQILDLNDEETLPRLLSLMFETLPECESLLA